VFLSIVQGLETLHARTSGEALDSPEGFADRVERILAGCPEARTNMRLAELSRAATTVSLHQAIGVRYHENAIATRVIMGIRWMQLQAACGVEQHRPGTNAQ